MLSMQGFFVSGGGIRCGWSVLFLAPQHGNAGVGDAKHARYKPAFLPRTFGSRHEAEDAKGQADEKLKGNFAVV